MKGTRRWRHGLVLAVVILAARQEPAFGGQCCGDCNDDGNVSINEIITAVNYALGTCSSSEGDLERAARTAFLESPDVQNCVGALSSYEPGPIEVTGTIAESCGIAGCFPSVLVFQTFRTMGVNPQTTSVVALVTRPLQPPVEVKVVSILQAPSCTTFSGACLPFP
jgi:hypothetical protein